MAITPTNAQAATVTVSTPTAITKTKSSQETATDSSDSLSFATSETTDNTDDTVASNADSEQTATTTTAASTTPTKAEDLNKTYNDAKDQTDTANKAATDANESLAALQKLLADKNLTQTDDWQDKLQSALTDFKVKSEAFTGGVTATDATVAAYQKAIDALIASKPNAVDKVTQGDNDSQGNSIAKYDNLVKTYKDEVEKQLAGLQNNLDNYDNASGVNVAQTALEAAAEALNTAMGAAGTTVGNLTDLKATYDKALTAYNAAVTAYNDKATTDIPTIETNKTGDSETTKNPSDQAFEDLKNYLNTKETYDAANDAYKETMGKTGKVTANLKTWQTAVDQYNAALKTLQDIGLSDITAVDAAEIKAAKAAVQKASDATVTAQKAYDAAVDYIQNNDEFAKISTDFYAARKNFEQKQQDAKGVRPTAKPEDVEEALAVFTTIQKDYYDPVMDALAEKAKALSAKLETLQAKVGAWNTAYTAYLAAVKGKATEDITIPNLPDFGTLGQSVTEAQTALNGSTADLQTSQDEYKAALDAYQAALDKNGINQKATDGTLPDLTAFNDSLQTQFTANNKTMAGAEALVAVKNAERALQQKANEINGYVTGINNTQAVWQATSDTSAETGAWNLLATQLTAIGNQFLTTGDAYPTAGESYKTLLNDYLTSIEAYNNAVTEKDRLVASTYTDADTVTSSISDFKASLDTFQKAYDTLMDAIKASAPDADANKKAQTSLSNGTQLSTDGTPSQTSDKGVKFVPQAIYMVGGSSLESIASQPFDVEDPAEGLVNFNIGQLTFDTDDLGNIKRADLIEGFDAQGNPIFMLSETDKARWMGVFRQKLLPSYVNNDNNKTYHLAGYFVPGTGTDATNPARPDGYYTFTTLDPITEFFNNFLGSTMNLRTNPSWYFYYVAEPDDITKTETDEEGQTSTVSAITMPTAEGVAGLTAVNTALALTAEGELTAEEPTVNAMPDAPKTLPYLAGGDSINTKLGELDISQAPTISLNQVKAPTDPTDPSDPTNPTNPTDPADPSNPSRPVNPDNGNDHDDSDDDHGNPNENDAEETGGLDKDENTNLPQTGGIQTGKQQVKSSLPQTGDCQAQQRRLQAIGSALLSLVVLVGGLTIRKRRDQRN